ncbi:uroporphyrinogen decarboxylase/cobalamine-independent methonine synthase family protein [Hoyosella subflava]|uniref:Cobalamin-independent methionine synthase MetE C-terminal/archaeal domain-containing protein n=1 Tax=Hoyosella subflava (strain DSM 45089 / JCM 17490 / NBRC 109087 / DQS3-9A1) TaxID=443218 RepID=F6ENJ1_HOYSD|nr:hypothetical protein [Hoyosella subflava]AEF41660.1 hypothetical protein AS9A_3215 [Hoyosella subflava DQS3-9A1]
MNVFATATGAGSWPGTEPHEAARVILGELSGAGSLPYLPELPARGVGADMIGRAAGLLIDVPVDASPSGYRLSAKPGALWRRAREFLLRDVDAFEEQWERGAHGSDVGAVKIQVSGPVTLAANLELRNGHPALDDAGATRDIAESLAEGVAQHAADVGRRLGVPIVYQIDEPQLADALEGRIRGVSVLQPVRSLSSSEAEALLQKVIRVPEATMVHTCSSSVPWGVLSRLKIAAAGLPVDAESSHLSGAEIDSVGAFLDSGRTLVFGVVPTGSGAARSAEELAQRVMSLGSAAGFAQKVLVRQAGVSPQCGLAGVSAAAAKRATGLARDVMKQLAAS